MMEWVTNALLSGGWGFTTIAGIILITYREQQRKNQEQDMIILRIMLHIGGVKTITPEDVVQYLLEQSSKNKVSALASIAEVLVR